MNQIKRNKRVGWWLQPSLLEFKRKVSW